ncbi:MAG: hypothetical protein ABIQ31_14335 [Ferruginibacter sp.]
MLIKYKTRISLVYAFIAAIIYSATVFVFLWYQSYVLSWLLYMGNALFGIVIAIFIYRYSKTNNYTVKISQLIAMGQKTTIIGILISCIMCLLLLLFLSPDVFLKPDANTAALQNVPGQLQNGNTNYLLMLFMDAIIGNISTGSFIAILFPFTIVRFKDQ